jgi:hypothetical protein
MEMFHNSSASILKRHHPTNNPLFKITSPGFEQTPANLYPTVLIHLIDQGILASDIHAQKQ